MAVSNHSGAGWPKEQIAKLKLEWGRGKSATEIAAGLRGRTRNAVIAKAHRLGLTDTDSEQSTRRAPAAPTIKRDRYAGNSLNARSGQVPKAKPFDLTKSKSDSTPEQRAEKAAAGQSIIEQASDPANDNAVPLIGRRFGQCAWPVGAPPRPADQLVCGAPIYQAIEKCAYCLTHARRAYARDITQPKPSAGLASDQKAAA